MAPSVAPELHPRDGFWGKATSTIDFCEENYVMSHYVTEFCKHYNAHSVLSYLAEEKAEPCMQCVCIIVCYGVYVWVGVGRYVGEGMMA